MTIVMEPMQRYSKQILEEVVLMIPAPFLTTARNLGHHVHQEW
jgi:hypothetical protein